MHNVCLELTDGKRGFDQFARWKMNNRLHIHARQYRPTDTWHLLPRRDIFKTVGTPVVENWDLIKIDCEVCFRKVQLGNYWPYYAYFVENDVIHFVHKVRGGLAISAPGNREDFNPRKQIGEPAWVTCLREEFEFVRFFKAKQVEFSSGHFDRVRKGRSK